MRKTPDSPGTPPPLTLIAAMAHGRVIGMDNRIPWHLPEDLKYFRQTTQGHPVIMGRKTWESLPETFCPLPDRLNIVVSRQPDFVAKGAKTAVSLEEAMALATCSLPNTTAFVIGGEQLYALALPYAYRLMLTEIDLEVAGNRHFPGFDRKEWQETSRQPHAAKNGLCFAFVVYERIF